MQFHTLDEISYMVYNYLNGGQGFILIIKQGMIMNGIGDKGQRFKVH
jgi:hypothetical protein